MIINNTLDQLFKSGFESYLKLVNTVGDYQIDWIEVSDEILEEPMIDVALKMEGLLE